jgi:hypothetical protein
MAANSPITPGHDFFVGEDKALRWPVVDDFGVLIPITGWTIEFNLYPYKGGGSILTKPASIIDGPGGLCGVQMARGDTVGIVPGRWWYDLARTNAGSNTVLAYGFAELKAR